MCSCVGDFRTLECHKCIREVQKSFEDDVKFQKSRDNIRVDDELTKRRLNRAGQN